jgi:uroporphyrinogen decarboxylase
MDLWAYEFASANLPPGMGIFGCLSGGILEIALNDLFGYETLSYVLYDNPELARAVFDKIGNSVCQAYKRLIGLKNLVGFFQGDDMGFKTATLISPDFLRKYVLPWHKKLAELAQANNLLYILHSCGNLETIMEDLIKDVHIDAKHSFEDAIMPVTEAKKRYGDKVAILGGVDLDKLCRFEEDQLRSYVRGILTACLPGGGYALGTGNSVANYIPLKNYLIMLDEGLNYM